MARIRPIEGPSVQAGGSIQSQASGSDFGAQIGQAEQKFAGDVNDVAGVITQMQDAKNQVWENNAVSSFQLSQLQKTQDAIKDPDFAAKYGADGGKFASSMQEQYDAAKQDVIGQAPTRKSQQSISMQLTNVNNSLMQHAMAYQAQVGGSYVKDQLQQSLETDAKLAATSPGDTSMILDRGKTAIANAPFLSPEQRTEMLRDHEQNIALAAGMGIVQRNPEGVLATLAPDQLSKFKPTPRVLAAQGGAPVTQFTGANPNPLPADNYQAVTKDAAANYGVDPNFLRAQQTVESNGNPDAVSPKGAIGIAQFMPATAAQYGVDPKNPESAIQGQAAYMSDLLKMFNGDYKKAAAGYNWGQGNVQNAIAKYGNDWLSHAPEETQNYISSIFEHVQPAVDITKIGQELTNMSASPQEPSRAYTNPDWFNKLSWKQQFQVVREAEAGVRANQVRDQQQLVFQKQQDEERQKQIMNPMFDRLIDGKLNVDDVRNAQLDYEKKAYLINAIEKSNKGEAKTDPAVFNDLFQRINSDDAKNKISDDHELLPYVGNGISFDDLNKLRGEIAGKHTADGSTASSLKTDFFKYTSGVLDSSTMIKSDPTGKQKAYEFQQVALSYINAMKKKGVTVGELFDPTDKNYVGKLLVPFQRNISQQVKDYSDYLKQNTTAPANIAPRKPGENNVDYQRRISAK